MHGAKHILAVGLLLLAALVGPAHAQGEKAKLEIGYMPILPVSQLFVALEEGWLTKAGIDAEAGAVPERPGDGAGAAGRPARRRLFRHRPGDGRPRPGADIKVVASNIVNQIAIAGARRPGALFRRRRPTTAFARFTQGQGPQGGDHHLPRRVGARHRAAILAAARSSGIDPEQHRDHLSGRRAGAAGAADRRGRRRGDPGADGQPGDVRAVPDAQVVASGSRNVPRPAGRGPGGARKRDRGSSPTP